MGIYVTNPLTATVLRNETTSVFEDLKNMGGKAWILAPTEIKMAHWGTVKSIQIRNPKSDSISTK